MVRQGNHPQKNFTSGLWRLTYSSSLRCTHLSIFKLCKNACHVSDDDDKVHFEPNSDPNNPMEGLLNVQASWASEGSFG